MMIELIRQHIKDTYKAFRYGHSRPALWETRAWLRKVNEINKRRNAKDS